MYASVYGDQWRSQKWRGWGFKPPIRIEAVFTAVKLLLLNIITSL